jgi:hypothetical protein
MPFCPARIVLDLASIRWFNYTKPHIPTSRITRQAIKYQTASIKSPAMIVFTCRLRCNRCR